MHRAAGAVAAFFFTALLVGPVAAAPLTTPFDFSQSVLGLKVSVKGEPLFAILDTGVAPSLIDLADAKTLGLKIDQHDTGEASGFGQGRGLSVNPSEIEGLSIEGRGFPTFEALASDLTSLSHDGRPKLSVVLGYSFLSDKIVLIDYVADTFSILDRPGQAKPMVSACKARWTIPLKTLDSYPVIPAFHFGNAVGRVTLDTGSSGSIGLFRAALTLQGLQAALTGEGSAVRRGARGASTVKTYSLNEPVGFGPFTLPAGQTVFVHNEDGSAKTRVANIGNALLSDLKIKVMLDYRHRSMSFYGRCD